MAIWKITQLNRHALYLTAATALVGASLISAGCSSSGKAVQTSSFGETNGKSVSLFTLQNAQGMTVKITNFGGIITSIQVPDRNGNIEDVVLGYDSLQSYVNDDNYFGALIGRYGNRIAGGEFFLDGEAYQLEKNDGPNHLHGGSNGFHKQVWQAESFQENGSSGVKLTLQSEDGEGGYPGNLKVTAIYTLNDKNELSLTFNATTDKATPVNLTNHSYFNLSAGGSVLDHELTINAAQYTPVDETLIPTGELRDVEGTPFDFRQAKAIGRDINKNSQQLEFGQGYDHNFVLQDHTPESLTLSARVKDPSSGRVLEILTQGPAIQFYSGNFLDGTVSGKDGEKYEHRSALCLEPQFFPDSPNQPGFPSTILKPGETYSSEIVYRFSTDKT